MGLKLGPCTRKSMVHTFRPQVSVYNHFRRHFTPTILIHCFPIETLKKKKKRGVQINGWW